MRKLRPREGRGIAGAHKIHAAELGLEPFSMALPIGLQLFLRLHLTSKAWKAFLVPADLDWVTAAAMETVSTGVEVFRAKGGIQLGCGGDGHFSLSVQ